MDQLKPFIRKAKPEDAHGIHLAHMKSIQEVCSKDHTVDEINAWGKRPYKEDQRLNAINKDFVWVVEKDKCIEGFGHLGMYEKDNQKKAYIYGLYLTPDVLGFGLGNEIIKKMIETSASEGVKEITLESTLTAHDFYKSKGFEDSGDQKTVEINGQKIRCFPMRMILL